MPETFTDDLDLFDYGPFSPEEEKKQQVLTTSHSAYNAGWDCVMIDDCCGTPTENGKEVCLYNVGVSRPLLAFLRGVCGLLNANAMILAE